MKHLPIGISTRQVGLEPQAPGDQGGFFRGTGAVVLIDEYDRPLLDNIEKPVEIQNEIREGLRDFYSVIKEQDANLQFVFLTGVGRDLLRTWYNGYSFPGPAVYNPFDILLFISNGHSYRSYWFETGTLSFEIYSMGAVPPVMST